MLLIAQRFGGYTLGQADIMRKAMGKKKAEIMVAERERFVSGAIEKGYSKDDADAVFALIEPFAGYAFNKAHSWSYGTIAYQTAFLKAHYPVQYMTAVLQMTKSAPDTHARIAAAVAECSKLGIAVLPPDVNASVENFSVERRPDDTLAIRFGLGVVKNVGASSVEGIIAARQAGGPYRDVEDFCKRADLSSSNSRALEHLAKAGALDMLGDRGTLVMNAERLIGLAKRERELRESGQATMFDLFGSQVDTPMPALELEASPARKEDMLAWEKELLGVYVSEHPFKAAAVDLSRYTTHSLSDLTLEMAGQIATVAGMVNRVQARNTRDGRKFYIVDIEDLSASVELTVWSDTLELTGEATWAEGSVLLISVEVRDRGDRLSLSVRKAAPYDQTEGAIAGFAPEQWQVDVAKPRKSYPPRDTTASTNSKSPNGNGSPTNGHQNGHTSGPRPAPPQPEATTEASRPGVQPPVSGDSARLVVTIYETEDVVADEAVLRAVAGMLKDAPGRDEVRLVIHDAEGQNTEFDLPRAAVTDDLARSIRAVLNNRGTVVVTTAKLVGAA